MLTNEIKCSGLHTRSITHAQCLGGTRFADICAWSRRAFVFVCGWTDWGSAADCSPCAVSFMLTGPECTQTHSRHWETICWIIYNPDKIPASEFGVAFRVSSAPRHPLGVSCFIALTLASDQAGIVQDDFLRLLFLNVTDSARVVVDLCWCFLAFTCPGCFWKCTDFGVTEPDMYWLEQKRCWYTWQRTSALLGRSSRWRCRTSLHWYSCCLCWPVIRQLSLWLF